MQRSPRSTSPSQSPIDPHDREQDRDTRRARQDPSRSPPSVRMPQGISTPLPPIRNLHLPPPHASRHVVPAQHYSPEFPPSASYGLSTFFVDNQRSPVPASAYPPARDEHRMSFDRPPTAVRTQASSSAYPNPRVSPPEGESDQEQNDSERGPPKKKRRRQALSCTECKRRKIKCDRTHPCGPCSRRNEPEKCQWHVIEPVAHGAFRLGGVSYSDKYVTRAEWDDLYARYRVLEERCIRLEKIVLQLHPELAENPSYEVATSHPATMPSPRAPHLITTRVYSVSGPGVATSASNSAPTNLRVTPHTPVSAVPGLSPRHGPGSSVSSLPVFSNTGAEGSASARSESAPPPMHATTQRTASHRPPYSDRRTSASGSHTSLDAASERSVPHQVTETARGRPFTTPTSSSYALPPPPPPPEGSLPSYSPRRRRYSQGRSGAVPDPSTLRSPIPRATGLHGRSHPPPLSAVSAGRHMHPDGVSTESMHEESIADNHGHYGRDTGHERPLSYELPERYRERDMDSKNGMAQAFEADDVLRHRWSASSSNPREQVLPLLKKEYVDAGLTISPVLCASSRHTHSGGSVPPSPCIDSPEIFRSQRKRVRPGSLYLSLPSCGSAPETSPSAVVVH